MMEVITDPKEFIARLREGREEADANVVAWQTELTTGDCFIRVVPGCMIFMEVIDVCAEDRALFRLQHMQNIRPCRCYSELCVEGEYGSIHIATALVQLSREQFDKARANGWNGDKEALLKLLSGPPS